jgi:hypothetical protein
MQNNNNEPQPNTTPNTPGAPGSDEVKVQPRNPETESNPGKVGNDTEVDLDSNETQTYPKQNPPERH